MNGTRPQHHQAMFFSSCPVATRLPNHSAANAWQLIVEIVVVSVLIVHVMCLYYSLRLISIQICSLRKGNSPLPNMFAAIITLQKMHLS